MKKRILSLLLVLALVMALLPGLPVLATEDAPAPLDIQDGVTLHCWNWSFADIEARMADIAAMGYTAIQTSPIQLAKQPTANFPCNDWWVFYQPAAFAIDDSGNSALGTKAQFESMCAAAHNHGVKVIVDVVANHMGNGETGYGLSESIIADLKDDPDCWHEIYKNTSNYSSRQEVTQLCMAGLPDLNTGNPKVQTFVLNYLKECIDAGADGFRFDAVKHIETPDDGDLASNFWPTVIDGAEDYAQTSRGIDLYCYGELLDSPGGSLSVDSYTKYMSITDNSWSNGVLASIVSGGAVYPSYHKGQADKLVLWAESHDTYADGSTMDVSEENINKAWAIVAARADAMSLYLARPANMSQLLGAGSLTGWARPEVAAVNKFHNAYVGQGEYLGNESGIAYVVRGTSGAVLVNTKGGSADVNISIQNLAAGSYTDILTGNTFTVDLNTVTGTIGSASGIAVLMEGDVCVHATHDADGMCVACRALVGHEYDENKTCACGAVQAGERTVYFIGTGNWANVNFYSWYDDINIFTNAWPGNPMTHVEGNIYSCVVPDDIPNIIFNDGNSSQTENLVLPADKDTYNIATGKWGLYSESNNGCAHETHDADGICTECKAEVGHLYGDNASCVCGAKDPSRRIIYFTNSSKWGTVNFYSWYDGGSEITAKWPGDAMTQVEGNVYSCVVPADAKNIIFNNGASSQTDNLTLTDDMNHFDFATKKWGTYEEVAEPDPTEPPATDAPTEAPDEVTDTLNPTEPNQTKPGTSAGVVVALIAAGIAVFVAVNALVFRKRKKQ